MRQTNPTLARLRVFGICMAALVALNLVWYVLISTSHYQRLGWPFWFWRQSEDSSRFRWFSLLLDLGLAVFFSYMFSRWWVALPRLKRK
ncbi:MAG: hypothetical protein HZA31_12110 [Opitutae bacterium]|nr:hypothetical protein [Opitutae bacterium]